jgi:hypothetical protein
MMLTTGNPNHNTVSSGHLLIQNQNEIASSGNDMTGGIKATTPHEILHLNIFW